MLQNKRRFKKRYGVLLLAVVAFANWFLTARDIPASTPPSPVTAAVADRYTRFQDLNYLTFNELKTLSDDPNPEPGSRLARKLEKFWHSTILSNEAYYRGAKPHAPKSEKLGRFLRVATWNIEKSLNVDKAIELFTATEEVFDQMLSEEGFEDYEKIRRQRARLLESDVILLQEMEIGVKRSKYWNAAAKLAKALNMNYVYAPQYLEVDPVILGLETLELESGEVDQEAIDYFSVDEKKYKGVFGSAVLSRYPIKKAYVKPLETQPYSSTKCARSGSANGKSIKLG